MIACFKENIITELHAASVTCKFCGSATEVVRFGTYKGVQRYFCKKCGRKFATTSSLPGMRTPANQISSALSMFYEGMSLNAICRCLKQTYNYYPSDSAVYGWIIRFTKIAVSRADRYVVRAGNTWVADETVLNIGGQNVWFWDIIDDQSCFLLASHLSLSRTTKDAQVLMLSAMKHAKQPPKVMITDRLRAYLDGIERVFGADTKHVLSRGFRIEPNTNLIERFHGTLKDRTKVMRGMKNRETARLIMNGWLIHYNFFRPHEGLRGRTPGEAAEIAFPFENWAEVVTQGEKA